MFQNTIWIQVRLDIRHDTPIFQKILNLSKRLFKEQILRVG